MNKFLSPFLFLIFVFNLNIPLGFCSETNEVKNYVNDLGNQIIAISSNEKLSVDKRRIELIQVIDKAVDTNWIAKFVLGNNYRSATNQQKEQFKALYHQFMINTYGPKFNGYNGEKFIIVSITQEGNYYTAKCIFYPKNDAPNVNLDFRLRKNNDNEKPLKFLVFDVIAEGVSLIETQRSEFGSIISKDGLEKFLLDFENRVKNLDSKESKTLSAKHK